jgi:hypothetical protein
MFVQSSINFGQELEVFPGPAKCIFPKLDRFGQPPFRRCTGSITETVAQVFIFAVLHSHFQVA